MRVLVHARERVYVHGMVCVLAIPALPIHASCTVAHAIVALLRAKGGAGSAAGAVGRSPPVFI